MTFFRRYTATLFLLTAMVSGSFGQSADSTTATGNRQGQLKSLELQFRKLQSTNKNSQALEVLQRYGQIYNAGLQEKKNKEIRDLENSFIKNSARRKSELAAIREKSGELEKTIDSLEQSRNSLYSSVATFFIVLISFIIVILFVRRKKLRTTQLTLAAASATMEHLKSVLDTASEDARKLSGLKNQITLLNEELTRIEDKFIKIADDKNHPDSRLVRHLIEDLKQAGRICELSFEHPENETKVKTRLNDLIRDVAVLVQVDFQRLQPEFNYELILDLEGILPETEVYPSSLREALFCLISNSVRSVHNKSGNAPKGYKPKVTVSTRKLPRFIQIRIRDNGEVKEIESGGPDVLYSESMSENTMRLCAMAATKIIVGQHKGELVYETEPGAQCDSIIRFQTHILQ